MTTQAQTKSLHDRMVNELAEIFPEGDLRRPVFYRAKAGLRFEIGTGAPLGKSAGGHPRTEYVQRALERSITLFHACFPSGPDFLLLDVLVRNDTTRTDTLDVCSHSNLLGVVKEVVCTPHHDEEGTRLQLLFDTRERQPDILGVLRNTILSDFVPDFSALWQSVFFFDCDRHLLFHLYDDRGLDIASSTRNAIEYLYSAYNSWILDYDREQIDNVFKPHHT